MSFEVRCNVGDLILDDSEEWPRVMVALPRPGDLVRSSKKWRREDGRFMYLELEIKVIRWIKLSGPVNAYAWIPELVLGLPKNTPLNGFYDWYHEFTEEEDAI